jgi:hypothetical protein
VIIVIVHASLDSPCFLTDATGLDEILVSGLPKGHVLVEGSAGATAMPSGDQSWERKANSSSAFVSDNVT